MDKYEEIRKTLLERKDELVTWKAVAASLSTESGESISQALIWKVVHNETRSPKVARALNITSTRYRRSAEFQTKESLVAFDAKLDELGLTLSKLCGKLVEGEIEVR
jgi:hypothetical protein